MSISLHATTDAIAGFKERDVKTEDTELPCRRQAGQTGSNNCDVGFHDWLGQRLANG